jgi:hypothetical protein
MSYAIFQFVVIAAIVAWSLGFAARRMFPRACRAMQAKLAKRLAASSNAMLQMLGAKFTPKQVTSGAGCGNGEGCSSCGTCAPSTTHASDVHPLVFHPRVKQ